MKNLNFLDLLSGIYFLILGTVFVCFHKKLGAKATEFQERWFYKFSRLKKINQYGYLLGGVVFVVLGLLMALGKIKSGEKLW